MRVEIEAAPGIHRITESFTNWYLVEHEGRVTAVDTGLPGSWETLGQALPQVGRTHADISSVVLTHAHFDHLGFAERARRELGVPVYVHEKDVPLTGIHGAMTTSARDAVVTLDPYPARRAGPA